MKKNDSNKLIGIAAIGLGLWFLLKPKPAASAAVVPPTTGGGDQLILPLPIITPVVATPVAVPVNDEIVIPPSGRMDSKPYMPPVAVTPVNTLPSLLTPISDLISPVVSTPVVATPVVATPVAVPVNDEIVIPPSGRMDSKPYMPPVVSTPVKALPVVAYPVDIATPIEMHPSDPIVPINLVPVVAYPSGGGETPAPIYSEPAPIFSEPIYIAPIFYAPTPVVAYPADVPSAPAESSGGGGEQPAAPQGGGGNEPVYNEPPPSYNMEDILSDYHESTGSQYDFYGGGGSPLYSEPEWFYEGLPAEIERPAEFAGIKKRKTPNYI